MILADALTWTARQKPELIIDAATLTGACCVALGAPYSGLFTSDDALAHDLIKAGRDSLDDVWRLPIGAEYAKLMKTEADLYDQIIKILGDENGELLKKMCDTQS